MKRVHQDKKVNGLWLQRHAGGAKMRRDEGTVAVAARNTRWCSDGLEIAAENGERCQRAPKSGSPSFRVVTRGE